MTGTEELAALSALIPLGEQLLAAWKDRHATLTASAALEKIGTDLADLKTEVAADDAKADAMLAAKFGIDPRD